MGVTDIMRKVSRRKEKCAAVIVAAGSALRMNGTDKLMTELAGRPVIVHTLRAFERCESIKEIIVVTREDLLLPVSRLCVKEGFHKVTSVIKGGSTRAQSVQIGLGCVSEKIGTVAIHDGARPLVTEKIIRDTVQKAIKFGAAAPAVPVKDTIKVVHGGIIEATPERSALYAVQTPQVFNYDTYRAALQNALAKKLTLTDDCSAAEAFGLNVVIVAGDEENIKITTPGDLTLAKAILERRKRNENRARL